MRVNFHKRKSAILDGKDYSSVWPIIEISTPPPLPALTTHQVMYATGLVVSWDNAKLLTPMNGLFPEVQCPYEKPCTQIPTSACVEKACDCSIYGFQPQRIVLPDKLCLQGMVCRRFLGVGEGEGGCHLPENVPANGSQTGVHLQVGSQLSASYTN